MIDPAPFARRVIKLAEVRGLTLATAESCTAGCLALLLSDIPGASKCFHGGFVVYSKEQKTAALGVSMDIVAAHSAVSREVAEAMAKGVVTSCPADLGIAITGVAGPEADEDGNPVGLMHVAVVLRRGPLRHRRFQFGQHDREHLRVMAMTTALQLAEEILSDRSNHQTIS